MNLLVITNNPNRASFRQRIEIYLDLLSKNGINCHLHRLPAGYLARWKLFKETKKFDGVLLHKKCLNLLDCSILRKYSRKVIYDFDDAVMCSPKQPEKNSLSYFLPFKRTVELADMVIAGNSYLAGLAKEYNSNVEVLPTGLDVKAYNIEKDAAPDAKIRLVWIGSKSTLRYLAQIAPALEELGLRFDNMVLRMICNKFFDLKNMQVEKHRWSLDSQAQALSGSDIGLAPLTDNRFTRGKCGFKILQYAAAALPFVGSPVGVNGDYIQDSGSGYAVGGTQQWVNYISRLLEDSYLRNQMGRQGRSWVSKFDVTEIGKSFVNLIAKAIRV
jgi:glycosyltransferase involved in cell wall biosynthesis